MNNNENTPESAPKPDTIDVLVICWGVISIVFLAEVSWSRWTGKAEFLITEFILLLFGWFYLGTRKLPQIQMFRWRPVPRNTIRYLLILATAATVLLDELDRLIGLVIPIPEIQLEVLQNAFVPASFSEALLIVIGVVIFAPIAEESLFRGVVQQAFEKKWDITTAVLVSSLVFSVIHLQPWWMIQQLILAVFLGFLTWRWNSIIPAVIIHAANNIWAIRSIAGLGDDVLRYYLWGEHVNPILLVVALAIFWYSFRKTESLCELYKYRSGSQES